MSDNNDSEPLGRVGKNEVLRTVKMGFELESEP